MTRRERFLVEMDAVIPWRAVASGLIEFFIPTAGFAYGGDWRRGFLPNAFRIAAFIGDDLADGEFGGECDRECNAWAIAVMGTSVWAVVGAVRTARDHNARIRERRPLLVLKAAPEGGFSVGIRLSI